MEGNKENSPPKKNRQHDYHKDFDPDCICQRKFSILKCGRCYQFFKGRVSKTCPVHTNTAYLMDTRVCPYCFGPTYYMEISTEAEMLRCEGELPSDDDW